MFFNFLLIVSSSSSMFFDKKFQTKFLFPKKSTGFMFVNNILYVVICWCVVGVFSQRVESKENRTGLNFSSQSDNNRSAGLTMSGYINKLANNLLQQQHNLQTTTTVTSISNNTTETPEEEAPLLLKNKFPVTDFQPNKKNSEKKKDLFLLHSFFSKGSFFGRRNREKYEDKNKRRRPEKEVKNIKTTRVKNDDVDEKGRGGGGGVFRSAGSGSGLISHSQERQHKQITDSRLPFLRNHSDHGEDPQSDDVHIKILDTDARIRRNPNGFGHGWSRRNRYWRRPRHRGRKWRKKKRRRRWRGRSNTTTSMPPNRIETETGNRRVIISQPERKMNETHGGSSISQGRGYTYWNVPPFVLKMKRKLENKIEQMSNMLYNGLSATLYDISRRSRYLINKYAAIKEDTKQLLSDTYDTIEDIVQMNNKIYDSVLSLSAFERRLHERIYEHGISPTAGVVPNITAFANRNYHEINRQVWILLRKLKHMRNKFFQRNHTYAKHINYFNDRLEVSSDIISSQRIRIVDLMDMAMYVNNQVTNMTQFKIPKVLRQIYDKKHELITDNYHSRHRLYIAEQVHQDVTTFQKSCHLRLEELSQVNYTLLKNLPRPTRIPLTQKERRKLQQLSNKVEDHTENILKTSAEINNVLPPSINYGKKLILELSLESQSDSYKVWAFEKILNQRGQMEHAMHGKSDRRQWMKMKRKRIRRMRKKMPRLKHPVFKRNRRQVNEAEEDLNKIYDEIINMLTEIIKRLDEMWLNLFQVSPGNNGKCDPTGSEGSGGDDTEVDCERQGSGDMTSITESESGSTTSLSLTGNHDNDEGNDFVFADAKTVIMSSDHENFQSIVRNSLDRSKEQQRISRNLVHDVQDIKSSLDEVKEKKAKLESDVNESAEVVSIYDGLVANATEMRRLLKETEDKIKASQEKCAAVEKLAELVMADKDEMERLLKKKIKEKEKEKRLKKKKLKDKSVDSVLNYFDAKTKMEEKSGKKWGKKDKEEEEEDFSKKIFEENEETKAELRALIEKYLRLQKKEEEIKEGKKEKENIETGKEQLNKTRKGRRNKNDSNEKNNHLNKTRNEKNRSDSIKKKNRKKKESTEKRNERVRKKESEEKKNKIGKRRGEKTEDLPSRELEEDGRRDKMEEEKMEGEKINVKKKKKTERGKNNEKLSRSKKESQAIGNERGEIDVSSVLEIKKNLERVLAKLNEKLTHSKKWSHQERRKKRKRMKRKKKQRLNDEALADRKIIANEKEEGKLNEKEGKERNKEGKERNEGEEKERNKEEEGKERNKEGEEKERNKEEEGKERNKERKGKERNKEGERKEEENEKNKEKQDEGKETNKQREGKEEGKERRERKGKRTKMKKKQNLTNVALADRKIIANEKEKNVNPNEKDEKKKKKKEREENEEGKEKNEEERKGEEEEGKGRRSKEEREREEEEKRRRSKEENEEEEGKKRRDKNEKERMKKRKTEDKESRTKKNGGKERERKKEKNEEENKRDESKEVGEKKDRKKTDVNTVKRIKIKSKPDQKDEFKESRRNETIEKNAAIKESETNLREGKKNETKIKEKIKDKKESSVKRITVESKDNSDRKKRRRDIQKNVLEFDNKKNFRNRTKIEREDSLKDEENKRKTKEKKENKQRKKEKESKEMKENEGKRVKKRKGKKMKTMNEKRKKGTESNSEKELNDILEEKKALKTPERRSKNEYEEEEEEENGMSLKNLMNEKTKEINEEKKINKRKREKEKRREKNRKRQENWNEFGAKEEEEEKEEEEKGEKKNEKERNTKKKKKDNKKADDKKKKIDRPNKETNAILMALGMNFEKQLRIPQTIKSKQKKSKRIRLSEKVASPPILIQNEEQSLAEEMTNKSKEIEEDVHKTKKAVESIVNQLKEFSPDPCRVISKNIHQIRMNISGLIQKIQLARTIVSSMKIPVSLNGEQKVELELYPKSEASEIQTSVEICLKPQNPNSVILTLQANNSIGYSLSLVDSKPVLNVVDSNGKVMQTLESDIELKEDDWYQVFIHRFGQNFSLSVNRKGSELGNTMVQKNILELEPEQIPPSLAYLGGYPHNFPMENSEKLKGCIAYLTINGRFKHLFSPLETGSYPSVCKNGCESVRNTSMVFEGNGFAFLEFDEISEKTLDSIHFTFKTLQANALLLAIQKNSEMLLLILLTEGNLQIERKWKSSKIVKRSQGIQFSNGDQHSIQITGIEKQLGIKISSQEVEFEDKEEIATDDDDDLFDEGITLGGISTLAKNTSKYRSFTGCLSNVNINNKPLNLLYLKNGSHVYEGDCQKNVWVSCSHFTESSLPVSLTKYDYVRSISLLIDRNAQGTFLFLERESKFDLEFQLTRNSLEIFNLENEESRIIPKNNGSDFWHLLHIKDQKGNIHITLDADQSVDLSYEEDTGGWFASNANDFSMVVSVGGKLKGESESQKTFTGSISNFFIGNLKLYLNKEFGSSNKLSVCSRPGFKTFSKQLDCTVSVKE